jgi:hypothetical protein
MYRTGHSHIHGLKAFSWFLSYLTLRHLGMGALWLSLLTLTPTLGLQTLPAPSSGNGLVGTSGP